MSGQSPTRAPGPTAGGPRHSSTQRWHGGDGPQLLVRPPLVAVKGRSQRGCSLRARSRAEAGRCPEHPQPQPRFASPPERFSRPLFPQISPHRALGAPSHAKVPHPGTLLSQSQQLRGGVCVRCGFAQRRRRFIRGARVAAPSRHCPLTARHGPQCL